MERLTQWVDDGDSKKAIPRVDIRNNGHNKCCNKLAEYEDLEEQGLLVRLPCKIGDTLYCIDNGIVELLIVNSFRIYNFNRIEIDFENASGFTLCTFSGELDEGYFLTREESEKKLEEMKNKI